MSESKEDFKITLELQKALKNNPHVKVVHFDEQGNYFFTKHKVDIHEVHETGEFKGFSKGTKSVESLPGVVRGLIKRPWIENNRQVWRDAMCITNYKPIAYSLTAKEILDTKVSVSMNIDEKIEIMQKAAEISKDSDFQNVLAAIAKKQK